MKQFLSILVVGVLIVSGLGVLVVAQPDEVTTVKENLLFSEPSIQQNEAVCTVQVAEADSYVMTTGEPVLPVVTRTFTFPFGTQIGEVVCSVSGVGEKRVPQRIVAAPKPVPRNAVSVQKTSSAQVSVEQVSAVYDSDSLYPGDWIDYRVGVGLEDGQHVVFVNVQVFPVRYSPGDEFVRYASEAEVSVEYTPPSGDVMFPDEYDLVIIAPQEFESSLQPLVDHKENHGLKTNMVTIEDVVSEYDGRDNAEKVKYFIKDALEDWGITYVLLVGGLTSKISGSTWHVPVRYSHLAMTGGHAEYSYLTDLYFADIYKYENDEAVFDDWDSNGDDVFASWSFREGKDILDLYPDVYVGRLACRDAKEVTTVVNKIIDYENNADPSWFKRLILAGGDTFNDGADVLEGELANQKAAELLDDFETKKIWWSEGDFSQRNVMDAMNDGAGFTYLSGHGSPGMWMAKDFTDDPSGDYLLGLDVYHMPLLKNTGKLPIVIIGGCHNSMFNATFIGSLKGCIQSLTGSATWYWMPIPESFGWWFVKQAGGGAIATFGCTGLGLGTTGDRNDDGVPDCIQYLLTWLELRFFELYAENNKDVLGETWGTAISDYISAFPCNSDKGDRKTVEEWVMLGDPSLKIGGYQ